MADEAGEIRSDREDHLPYPVDGERRELVVYLREDGVRPYPRPLGRQQLQRQVGVEAGEAPPGVQDRGPGHQRLRRVHVGGPDPSEQEGVGADEVLVTGAQFGEVPGLDRSSGADRHGHRAHPARPGCPGRLDHPGRLDRRQDRRVGHAEFGEHPDDRLRLLPGGDPHAVVERRETQPAQPVANGMSDVTLFLRQREGGDDPPAVPPGSGLPERQDAHGAVLQRLGRLAGQAVVGVAADPRGLQQPTAREPAERRARADRRDVEVRQQTHQRRGRYVLLAPVPVVAEQGHEQTLRLGAEPEARKIDFGRMVPGDDGSGDYHGRRYYEPIHPELPRAGMPNRQVRRVREACRADRLPELLRSGGPARPVSPARPGLRPDAARRDTSWIRGRTSSPP